MRHAYYVLDVFTQQRLAGNPVAIVLGADGIPSEQMQGIAREFNLPETVFVTGPPAAQTPVRIFTPQTEVPFAGHPVIGTAALFAALLPGQGEFVLNTNARPVQCRAHRASSALWAAFEIPGTPQETPCDVPSDRFAALLGLGAESIGFDDHVPSIFAAGLPVLFVPIRSLAALAMIKIAAGLWADLLPVPLPRLLAAYTPDGPQPLVYRARAFAPLLGTLEDAATGAAAAAFGGALARFELLADGPHCVHIEQGYEIHRPSRIDIEITVAHGTIERCEIQGHAVLVAHGTLDLS